MHMVNLQKIIPQLGGVAGLAAYDIGKGILGKVKKYTKAIVTVVERSRNQLKQEEISAGT